ncbi:MULTISPECIES: DedA family protein [unclassified Iodobacter]|uniref:DedA family protein n=1 Tax=unclassified Iodobacter TaxID=235634 RepID=UPI0025F828BB|nr:MULTISPECIES: DedA family protein [unclassified Iodobacter]MDW5418374.1 DedA family protein [Iodobacter sp. CM08]
MEFNPVDVFLHLDVYLAEIIRQYGNWVYALLFSVIFVETGVVIMPFLPGDSLLFVAGMLAGGGHMNLYVLMGLLFTAAVLGDAVNYTIGRYFGHKLFANKDSKIFRQDYLQKTHAFYERHGGKTIILARFVPIVRTFAPFVAGMAAMSYHRFLMFNLIGAAVWVVSLLSAGYFLGGIPFIAKNIGSIAIALVLIPALPVVIEFIKMKFAKAEA